MSSGTTGSVIVNMSHHERTGEAGTLMVLASSHILLAPGAASGCASHCEDAIFNKSAVTAPNTAGRASVAMSGDSLGPYPLVRGAALGATVGSRGVSSVAPSCTVIKMSYLSVAMPRGPAPGGRPTVASLVLRLDAVVVTLL